MRISKRLLMSVGSILPIKLRLSLYRAAGMIIGSNTRITQGFYVDRPEGVEIGNHCFLNHFCHMHNGADDETRIILGNDVFIGPEVNFICASHDIGSEEMRAGKDTYGSIIVENGVWIGADVTILPGVRIARGGVIGAGAVVTKSTEPNGLYLGVPAKRIRDLNN